MQKGKSIINAPLLTGIVLSIAIHVGALRTRAMYAPPRPMQEPGRTVVHLTLVPSLARQAPMPEPSQKEPHPETATRKQPAQISVPEPQTEAAITKPSVAPSQEQMANLIEDEGIISASSLPGASMPPYPRASRRRGEEGTVFLSIEVLASGKAGSVEVIKSSGYRRLDEAAIHAAKEAAYQPATIRSRQVDSTLTQPFVFELTQ